MPRQKCPLSFDGAANWRISLSYRPEQDSGRKDKSMHTIVWYVFSQLQG